METIKNNTIALEDPGKFTMVKADIRQASKVNGIHFKPIDKMIYCYLLGWQRSKENPNSDVKEVRPQFRKIQAEHGVSKGTVESTMKTLEQIGLIIVTRKLGGVNIYDVVEFDQVVATHLEIKKDDFILNREAGREEREQQKSADPEVKQPKAPAPTVQLPKQQPEPKKQQTVSVAEDDIQTNWSNYGEKLKSSSTKWKELSSGQQCHVMLAVNDCNSTNFFKIKTAFDVAINKLFNEQAPKQQQQINNVKPTVNQAHPALAQRYQDEPKSCNCSVCGQPERYCICDIPF